MKTTNGSALSALVRFLGTFGVGCLLHILVWNISFHVTQAVVHQGQEDISGWVVIAFWPLLVILIGLYALLAARVKWWRVWAIAAVLGLVHGVGFALFVFFQTRPSTAEYKPKASDVVVTFNAACANQPLPDDPQLRELIDADRNLDRSLLPHVRGDRGIAYDLDGDSKAELIIPVRCDAEENCFWVVAATNPIRNVGYLFGARLYIMPSDGPWRDVVGYSSNPASVRRHQCESHGPASGYSYSAGGDLDLKGVELERFLADAPSPRCSLENQRE